MSRSPLLGDREELGDYATFGDDEKRQTHRGVAQHQSHSHAETTASAPAEDMQPSPQGVTGPLAKVEHRVEFRKPNVLNREQFATFVNSGGIKRDDSQSTYEFFPLLYWLSGVICGLGQQATDNGPTQVTIGRSWKNTVFADTHPVTRTLSYLTPITAQFDFASLSEANPYLHRDDIHLIYVPPGKYAKVIIDNKPVLLEASDEGGYHAYKTANFVWEGLVDTNTDVIHVGNAYVINVKRGYAVVGNAPNAQNDEDKFFVYSEGFYTLRSDVLKLNKTPIQTTLIQIRESLETTTFEPVGLKFDIYLSYNIKVKEALTRFDFSNLQKEIDTFVKNQLHSAVSAVARGMQYTELMKFQAKRHGEQKAAGPVTVQLAPVAEEEEHAAEGEAKRGVHGELFQTIGKQIREKLESSFQKHGLTVSSFGVVDIRVSDQRLREQFQHANQRVVEERANLSAALVAKDTAIATAEAYAESEKKKAEGDAEALRTRNAALQGANPAAIQQALFSSARMALPDDATVILTNDGHGVVDAIATAMLGRNRGV